MAIFGGMDFWHDVGISLRKKVLSKLYVSNDEH